jgi:tetratricopeptide (TPR) repeat protein
LAGAVWLRTLAAAPPGRSAGRSSTARTQAGAAAFPAHERAAALPAEIDAALRPLRGAVEANPDDLGSRQRLTRALLEHGLWVEAFDEAEAILRLRSLDPDALMAQASVRLEMGQPARAAALLDQVLAQQPRNVAALLARGRVHARMGESAQAMARWERALAAAGGRQPEIEPLLAEARARAGQRGPFRLPREPSHPE